MTSLPGEERQPVSDSVDVEARPPPSTPRSAVRRPKASAGSAKSVQNSPQEPGVSILRTSTRSTAERVRFVKRPGLTKAHIQHPHWDSRNEETPAAANQTTDPDLNVSAGPSIMVPTSREYHL